MSDLQPCQNDYETVQDHVSSTSMPALQMLGASMNNSRNTTVLTCYVPYSTRQLNDGAICIRHYGGCSSTDRH